MERQPISREGFEKLKEEIRFMEEEEMPNIAQMVADARSEGDLSENAEYHGQRERQGLMQAKINQLKTKLASCYIVDKSTMPKGIVTFGSIVTVKDIKYDDEETYEFVGPGEEDYDSDIMKIVSSGPLAKALMGMKVGDVIEFTAPRGTRKLEITKIEDHEGE
jgi:transcription elongation factor GreA